MIRICVCTDLPQVSLLTLCLCNLSWATRGSDTPVKIVAAWPSALFSHACVEIDKEV